MSRLATAKLEPKKPALNGLARILSHRYLTESNIWNHWAYVCCSGP